MVCRGYLNKAVILWKNLETRCPRDALSLIKVEYAPHPRPGSEPGAQAQRRPFPLLAGREYPCCGPGQTCNLSVLVSGQEGTSWACRGTSRKVLHGCQGHPARTKPGAASPSVTPRLVLALVHNQPSLTVRALSTWFPPAFGNVCSLALHMPLFQWARGPPAQPPAFTVSSAWRHI